MEKMIGMEFIRVGMALSALLLAPPAAAQFGQPTGSQPTGGYGTQDLERQRQQQQGLSYASQLGVPKKENPRSRILRADMCLKDFEREVEREHGGMKGRWVYKTEALTRVKELKQDFPDDPDVEALFERAKAVLKKSLGQLNSVDPAWTQYKRNEEELRRQVWEESAKVWDGLLASAGTNVLETVFPSPDPSLVPFADVRDKLVVLNDVQYPANQFFGGSGEYIACGMGSKGFYFISLAGRDWLGPYEAVKRYRRACDTGLMDVQKWTVLGRITGVTIENPEGAKSRVGRFEIGWIVTPVALKVPDRVVAFVDREAPFSGRYACEERIDALKSKWYTVKSVPPDVTPEGLMEIYIAAIKEKNFDLYMDCIDPRRREGFNAYDYKDPAAGRQTKAYADLIYHWDLHQERFHNEYIHAKVVGKARITMVKGFDGKDTFNDFFLDEGERKTYEKAGGEKQEFAEVDVAAIDPLGKQLGGLHPHKLVRFGGARWYVLDYAPRF